MQYDLTDYTQELDAERRELNEEEYCEWLDSLNEEEFEEEFEKPGTRMFEL